MPQMFSPDMRQRDAHIRGAAARHTYFFDLPRLMPMCLSFSAVILTLSYAAAAIDVPR